MSAERFRKAVEASDLDEAMECFADVAVLHSPVTFRPFEGKDAIRLLFSILFKTFEDFRYVREFQADDGTEVLHFRSRVGDREVEGIDMIHTRDDGLIDDFTVMVRPLSAALALRDAVGAQLGMTG